MSPIPLRTSLHDQLVTILRQGIAAARWRGELPGEAALCRELQVSRMTLRKALAQLVRERWITLGGRGRHHRIRRKPAKHIVPSGRIIRALSPFPLTGMGAVSHVLLNHLTERIATAGYRIEFEHHPRLFQQHQPAKLRELNSLPETAAWVLFFSTEPMPRWFAASGRPCVVLGRLHPGVELPCVFSDFEAAARHAAGLLCARGHRELVYLRTDFTSHNDLRGSEEFVAEAQRLGAHAQIVVQPPDAPSVHRALDDIFATRPRPSGFFAGSAAHALTALCYLLGHRVRIPTEAALICGWDDDFLQYAIPKVARYRADGAKMGRKAATLLLDVIRHGTGKIREVRIIPDFVPGGTLDENAA